MKLTDMSEKQIERYAAVEVMGLKDIFVSDDGCVYYPDTRIAPDEPYADLTFSPLTKADDDVMVLDEVVANWDFTDQRKFHTYIAGFFSRRVNSAIKDDVGISYLHFLGYETGFYTRAAVAVVLGKKEKKDD